MAWITQQAAWHCKHLNRKRLSTSRGTWSYFLFCKAQGRVQLMAENVSPCYKVDILVILQLLQYSDHLPLCSHTQTSHFCFPKHLQLVHLYLLVFRNLYWFHWCTSHIFLLRNSLTLSSTHLLEISEIPPTFDKSMTFKQPAKTAL